MRKPISVARVLFVFAILCGVFPTHAFSAGIAFDAASRSSNPTNVASVSWTHTVVSGGSTLGAILVVGAVARDSTDADRVVTRVTYNGVDLTKIRQDDETVNNVYSSLWYLVNPPTGSHTVVVTYAAPVTEAFGMAATFTGVDQSSPVASVAGLTQSAGTTASQSVGSVDGSWLVDAQYAGADGNVATTAGQTALTNQVIGAGRTSDHALMTMKGPTASTSIATSFSYSESSQVALSIISLRPATASVPPPAITSVNPTSGSVGAMVTIAGSNFGSSAANGTLRFNGTSASPSTWSNTSITAAVPAGATTGNVIVTVNGVASNGVAFTVAAPPSSQTPSFIQSNYSVPQTPQTSVATRFNGAQTAGNLNVVAIGWADTTATVSSVTDSKGNVYRAAVGPTVQSGIATHAIFYAANIAAAAASGNTVTVTFSSAARFPDIRVAEYSGIDRTNPVDVTAAAMGSGAMSSSNSVRTTNATDLLIGANKVRTVTMGPGAGYSSRMITSPNGHILEDRVVSAIGSYNATAPLSGSDSWIMQFVAFRAAGSTPPPPDTSAPTTPTNVAATGVSPSQISVTWSASTDNVAVTDYTVYRNNVAVGTTQSASYTDSGLNPSTTYSYSVAARDAAGNVSGRSANVSGTTLQPTTNLGPLRPSANGRYLVDQNNAPFIVIGDSARSLVGNISLSDASTYFAARRAQGFNLVWINLLCNNGTGCRADGSTFDGIAPFTSPGNLTTPNEAYFQRVDQILNLAASNGFTVMLDPAETIGWLSVLRSNGTDNARTYGRYLGNRYKNFNNLIWASGNDFQTWRTATDDAVVLAVALGIRDNDQRHIHTVQLDYQTSGSYDDANWIPIIGIDAAYTYYPTYFQVLKEYNRSTVPVVMVEANYEFENNTGPNTGTTGVLRRQEYWTYLSGGGHIYGSFYTNHFESGWRNNLQSPGAEQMIHVKTLLQPRRWYDLVPDQNHSVVTAGYGTAQNTLVSFMNNDYVTAARTADGALVIAYLPKVRSVTVDMSKLAGPVTARWFDPSNGNFIAIGSSLPNSGSRSFTPPGNNGEGDTDWLLVLETGS